MPRPIQPSNGQLPVEDRAKQLQFQQKRDMVAQVLTKSPGAYQADRLKGPIAPHSGTSTSGAAASKKRLLESGQNPETEKQKKDNKTIGQFFASILSGIRDAIGSSKIVAYFHRSPQVDSLSLPAREIVDYLSKNESLLKEEAIFSASGHAEHVKKLVDDMIHHRSRIDLSKIPLHDLASALKEIYGKMNLFGRGGLKDDFIKLGTEIGESKKRGEGVTPNQMIRLKGLVGQLSKEQQQDLKALLEFLGKIVENQSVNKMSAENLAHVFGPRLVFIEDPGQMIDSLRGILPLTVELIRNRNEIFVS